MLYQAGDKVPFGFIFTDSSGDGKTPSPVPTVDIDRLDIAAGTLTQVVTGGALTAGNLTGEYLYVYTSPGTGNYAFIARARTTDTSVQAKTVWSWGETGRTWVGRVDEAVSAAKTLTSAYDAAKTAATQASVNALPTAAGVRAEMDANSTKLANLDAAVTSRLAGASYSAPPSAASVADAVWDEATADHAATGTTGKALANAGSAADPLTNTVPGTYASGTAGAALGRIGSGQITTTSPVATSGDVTIVRGDDYNSADGRALDWTDVSAAWPDLTGASVLVTVQTTGSAQWTKAGSVVTPTGSGKKVRVEPTAADTATFAGGASYPFDVQATLSSGRKVTLLRGTWYVLADYSV